MKDNVNHVNAEDLTAIVSESSATCFRQRGFTKVSGASGRNIYIANTKRVARVDISGFNYEGPGVINLNENEWIGNVHQQLDFSLEKEAILANFKSIIDYMLTLPAVEKVVKAKENKEKVVKQIPDAITKSELFLPAKTAGNPTELNDIIEYNNIDEHRNLDCAHYDDCVDVAAEKDWKSFTCANCPFKNVCKSVE